VLLSVDHARDVRQLGIARVPLIEDFAELPSVSGIVFDNQEKPSDFLRGGVGDVSIRLTDGFGLATIPSFSEHTSPWGRALRGAQIRGQARPAFKLRMNCGHHIYENPAWRPQPVSCRVDPVTANPFSSAAVGTGRYAGSSMIVRLDAANGMTE
jgi:hypothetical protein